MHDIVLLGIAEALNSLRRGVVYRFFLRSASPNLPRLRDSGSCSDNTEADR